MIQLLDKITKIFFLSFKFILITLCTLLFDKSLCNDTYMICDMRYISYTMKNILNVPYHKFVDALDLYHMMIMEIFIFLV